MTRTSSEKWSTLLVVTLALATPLPSHAEPSAANVSTAKTLVVQGRDARTNGDHGVARDRFKAAYALVPTPIIGMELSREHVVLGELIEARQVALDVGALAEIPGESPESKTARADAKKLASELKDRIPNVVVSVSGAPAGGKVTVDVDGQVIPSSALGKPFKVNPGSRVVTARHDGGGEVSQTVEVKQGATRQVALSFKKGAPVAAATEGPSTATATAASSSATPASTNTLAWVGFGVAGVGLAVAGLAGGVALSKQGTLDAECANAKCPPAYKADVESYQQLRVIAWSALGAAVVGGVVGVVALSRGASEERPQVALHTVVTASGAHASLSWAF